MSAYAAGRAACFAAFPRAINPLTDAACRIEWFAGFDAAQAVCDEWVATWYPEAA